VLLALLALSTFWHARLGLRVLIEDYVHDSANKVILLTALNLVACGAMVAALVLIARIEIAGSERQLEERSYVKARAMSRGY